MYGGLHSPSPLPSETTLSLLAREFTPRVEARGPTPVLLDLHGLGRVWPTPEALGQALLGAMRDRALTPHVALAGTRVAALVLACARAGLTIVPAGEEAAALAPLPLNLLDLDPDREELLRRWGVRTLGDLAALPAAGLAERFGLEGPRLRRLARGMDDSPLVPAPLPERFEMAMELDWPVDGLEPFSFLLARVLEPLCANLKARGRRAVGLSLELGLVDGTLHRRALHFAAPLCEPRTCRSLLLLDLEAHPPRDAILAIRVRVEPTPARSLQFSLLDPAQPCPERLAETLARLEGRAGAGRVGAASLLDTHRPGAFALGSFAPGSFVAPRSASAAGRVALRAFRPPLPARVAVRDGAPVFVASACARGVVMERAGPWRASGDWWDAAWSREEWDVALASGVYRIFKDRLSGAWFVDGELD